MPSSTIKERILNSITTDDNGCWIWQKRIASNGYGQMWITTGYDQGATTVAHRVSYKVFKGNIPTGYHIDHLCKVRSCVNPNHLEAVTPKENVHRSDAKYKEQMARTHCPQGHEYTIENMYTYPTKHGGVARNCRTCMRERTRARYQAKKELAHAA